jgi:eukaryotic-like serine/threonine-protein kinase
MTPDRWALIDHLLDLALEQRAGDRDAYLAEACRGDEELLREIETLLAAHDAADGGFMRAPAIEIAAKNYRPIQKPSLLGRTLGHYTVVSALGSGGMGEVYLAHDQRLDRRLALKLLPPEYTREEARLGRFEREARAASALNHPNIVTIYEIGEIEETHFIAMEYVDGRTLREKIEQGRLSIKESVEIAIQIAGALAAAHEAGIVHRDIKPENVMVRRDGYVKVLDFGLVKLTEHRRSDEDAIKEPSHWQRTSPGVVLGTVSYMSPEQALGHEVDHRSDVFSLGVVLYELIAGARPFKGATDASILDAIVHHHQVPMGGADLSLSPACEQIVARALEKNREQRYQSAADLQADLKRFQRELDASPTGEIEPARRTGEISTQVAPWKRRRRWATVLAALVAAAALVAGWMALRRKPVESSPWLDAYASQVTDFPGEERDLSLAADGKTIYYSRTLRGQRDIFRQRLGGSNAQNLTGDSNVDDYSPVASPDGDWVVFRSEGQGGGLFLMGATGESARRISDFGYNPSWSPDGKQIVCGTDYVLEPNRRGSESKLWIINIADGAKQQLAIPGDAAQPRWSPHGKRVAYFGGTNRIQRDIWTAPLTGGKPTQVTNDQASDWDPVWAPDGRSLYFVSARKGAPGLWRVPIDEETGTPLGAAEAVTGPSIEVMQFDLSKDGKKLAYMTRTQMANLQAVDFDPIKKAALGQPVWITQGTRPSGSPDVSPDGKLVVYHTLGSAEEDIFIVPADGAGAPVNLTSGPAIDRLPRWSADGTQIAYYSNDNGVSQIWLVNRDGGGRRPLTRSDRPLASPFWSPDGQRLGYCIIGGPTFLIDLKRSWQEQTPWELPRVNAENDWFIGGGWSPDGKRIAGVSAGYRSSEVRTQPGVLLFTLDAQRYDRMTDIGARPAWLRDNRHLIFLHQGKLFLLDSQTRKNREIYSHPQFQISSLAISPDNRRLYYTATAHEADIHLLSLEK